MLQEEWLARFEEAKKAKIPSEAVKKTIKAHVELEKQPPARTDSVDSGSNRKMFL